MKYIFSLSGKRVLQKFCRDQRLLLAFDYDGTLTKIRIDPFAVRITEQILSELEKLSQKRPVVILSGRGLKDLRRLIPKNKILLVGNHGLEGLTSGSSAKYRAAVKRWYGALKKAIEKRDGIEIEKKSFTLSVHYRTSKNRKHAKEKILDAVEKLSPAPRVVGGKAVYNLLPSFKMNKGEAVIRLMKKKKCRRALFVGDDVTDEDVFCLPSRKILKIRVGTGTKTCAEFFVKRQPEVGKLLKQIGQSLKNT